MNTSLDMYAELEHLPLRAVVALDEIAVEDAEAVGTNGRIRVIGPAVAHAARMDSPRSFSYSPACCPMGAHGGRTEGRGEKEGRSPGNPRMDVPVACRK